MKKNDTLELVIWAVIFIAGLSAIVYLAITRGI